MVNFHFVTSKIASQKLNPCLEEFIRLDCPVGSPVQVSKNEGTFICKVYPKLDLSFDSAIVETTVQLYKERHETLLKQPMVACWQQSVIKLNSQSASSVAVTLVTESFQTNSTLCKYPLKNVLANRYFSQQSTVNVKQICPSSQVVKVLILEVKPEGFPVYSTNSKTKFTIKGVVTNKWFDIQSRVSEVKLGGLSQVYEKLKELVVQPLQNPQLFSQLKVPRGILLHGPSGSGKSAVIQQLCHEFQLHLMPVTCSDLSSSEPGGSEEKLSTVVREAAANTQPTVLFLDDIDAICPKAHNATKSHTQRLTNCLVNLIENLQFEAKLTVVAATSRLEEVDPSLRRPGRLDREIPIHIPDVHQRLDILQVVCTKLELNSDAVDLELAAEMTPGYVGADLDLLCRETSYLVEDGRVTLTDWKAAISRMRPSVMRQGPSLKFRKVTWDQVGGLEEAKLYIRRSVEWPLKHPEAFERLNVPRPRGVLIYGPPGCGKSLLVRAAATACSANFISISAAELFSPFVGDSEKMVASLFQRARLAVPTILFLDELDAMVGGRSTSSASHGRTAQLGVVTTLLQEMDGIWASRGVVVVGATNRPDKIDNALLRPGRFDSLVYIPNPDCAARRKVLESVCRKMPLHPEVDLDSVAERTDFFSGADLESLAKEAALSALEEDLSAGEILPRHFDRALGKVSHSLTPQQIEGYRQYSTAGAGK